MMREVIICDIDGVIADSSHRVHLIQSESPDWDAFFSACSEDAPIKPMIRLLQGLSVWYEIVYMTGRPQKIREKTVIWFEEHGIPRDARTFLMMRENGDHRPDFELKLEFFNNFVKAMDLDKTQIVAVFEDRDQVVEMWRAQGLLCLQPKKGDY